MSTAISTRGIAAPLAVYAFSHATVDAGCAALLLGGATAGRISTTSALSLFLVYNIAAFALQPVVGLLVDRRQAVKAAAVAGAILTALALPLSLAASAMVPALVLAGLGNAIFHVGGGAASLRMSPGRASAPGIFVAPGAAGLAAGTLLGKAGGPLWVPVATLLVCAAAMALLPQRSMVPRVVRSRGPLMPTRAIEISVLLVLAVVALRSYTGLAIALPWKSSLPLLAALTAAVVLGKALGGVLADRFGRARIGVGALAVSAPLLMFAPQVPLAGILGMFAFNMTMPVTLVAVADVMPDAPGFAFGLASLALAVGAFPVLAGLPSKLDTAGVIGLAVGVSAVTLGAALWRLSAGSATRRTVREAVLEATE